MTDRGPEVVCAGIIVVDHVAAPIDHLPASGELVLSADCGLFIGGCAANVAIDLSKLGVRAQVVGGVGDDAFGDFARQAIEAVGVDVRGIITFAGVPTSQTLVVNVIGEDRRFIHTRGANDRLKVESIAETLREGVRVLYLGGLFLMEGLDGRGVARLFEQARARGIATVLDVVTPGPRDYAAVLQTVLPFTDLFLPNEDEGYQMTGERDAARQAELFHAWGARQVAITRGGKGALVRTEDAMIEVGVYDVHFVDGTGGGDAFAAGFVSGMLEGLGPRESLIRASALGASCVQKAGATEGVWNRAELDAFVAREPLPLEHRPLQRKH